MTSFSDTEDSSSSDDESLVFYDANNSFSQPEITTPLHSEPRWRAATFANPLENTEHIYTVPLTEKQLQNIERRDRLQHLRDQDNSSNLTNRSSTITFTTQKSSVSSTSTIEQQTIDADTSTESTFSNNRHDNSRIRNSVKNSPTNRILTKSAYDLHDFPNRYETYQYIPGKSVRGTGGHNSNTKSISSGAESNIVDPNVINSITKFGEFYPNTRKLNDDEILQQPIVKDLDNGKYVPFVDANPMMETILKRGHLAETSTIPSNSFKTTEYSQNSIIRRAKSVSENIHRRHSKQKHMTTDNFSISSEISTHTDANSLSHNRKSLEPSIKEKKSIKSRLTRLFVPNIFQNKHENKNRERQDTLNDDDDDDVEKPLTNDGSNGDLKYKSSRYLKERTQFDKTQLLQTIVDAHIGPIWCMRFSPDGQLLATGGQDCLLKIWLLKSARKYFDSQVDSTIQQIDVLKQRFDEFHQKISVETVISTTNTKINLNDVQTPFYGKAFCVLLGHQAPVLDVAWSKSLFLLSSSMDKTVRLWHLNRLECLCFFRHVDFVSAIAFHPRDDRYFVSASLDGHVRLWNIPDKRVVHWTLIPMKTSPQITAAQGNLITAINFCDDGRKVIVGTFDGRFLLYTDTLKYDTVMNIGDKDNGRNNQSKIKRRKPSKITGIESMNSTNSKVLITSNDSRIRIYNIRTKEIEKKYRGYLNQSSQIRASFSHDDRYIISGSEDGWFYIWRTEIDTGHNSTSNHKLTSRQRRYLDRAFERIRVHNTVVTSAIFAPNPSAITNDLYSSNGSTISAARLINHTRVSSNYSSLSSSEASTYVIVTADSKGQLKLLINRHLR